MPNVRAIMMQKDEGDALARWLAHYSGLFGAGSLTILDNGSTDELTLNHLGAAEAAGTKVLRQFGTSHDFRGKGGHFGNIIKSWDHDFNYDFAFPLDCDEILAVFTRNGVSTTSRDIHDEFDRLVGIRRALRLDMSLFNVPYRPGWFAPVRHFHKGFLPAKSLRILDNGRHAPESSLEAGYSSTRFTYLHWHNLGFDAAVERARTKLTGYVDLSDREALIAYANTPGVPGAHAVATMLRTEDEYRRIYDHEVRVFVTGSDSLNLIEAGGRTFVWDTERYLRLHDDVAKRYELTALHHYLRFGFVEGREA